MAVYLQGPTVRASEPSLADSLSEISAAIPAQLNQTRKQLASIIASSATPVALAAASATTMTSGVVAATAPVVNEMVVSLAESKILDITSPRAIDPEVKTVLEQRVKQDVLNAAQGVEVHGPLHDNTPQIKRITTPFGDRIIPEHRSQPSGLLDHAFGEGFKARRERDDAHERANQSIIPPRMRSLL